MQMQQMQLRIQALERQQQTFAGVIAEQAARLEEQELNFGRAIEILGYRQVALVEEMQRHSQTQDAFAEEMRRLDQTQDAFSEEMRRLAQCELSDMSLFHVERLAARISNLREILTGRLDKLRGDLIGLAREVSQIIDRLDALAARDSEVEFVSETLD